MEIIIRFAKEMHEKYGFTEKSDILYDIFLKGSNNKDII